MADVLPGGAVTEALKKNKLNLDVGVLVECTGDEKSGFWLPNNVDGPNRSLSLDELNSLGYYMISRFGESGHATFVIVE